MRKKYKYFKPNQIITLFDITRGDYPYGVLLFPKNPSPTPVFTRDKFQDSVSLINFNLLFKFIRANLPSKIIALNIISTICITIALLGVLSFVYPYISSQINSLYPKQNVKAVVVPVTPSPSIKPQTTEFILTIPSINITSDVVSDVDIKDEEVYKQELKRTGVAHTKGTSLPGQNDKGPMLLFAHSTDTIINIAEYNAKFFSVPDLQNGDQIQIQYHGTIYTYKVTDKKIIDPTDFDSITGSKAALILMTCTPPGTDWQRLLIYADKITEKDI